MALRVLYLDDEPMLCELFSAVFSSAEVEVDAFTDAQSAIDSARKSPPDLAFLDYRLQEMNGDEVAQLMPPEIPKYLLSGDILISPTYPFLAIYAKPSFVKEVQDVIDEKLHGAGPTAFSGAYPP